MKKGSIAWQETLESIRNRPANFKKPQRRKKTKTSEIPTEFLKDMYLNKHLTFEEIGKLFGIGRQRICQLFKERGIDISQGERFITHCALPSCNSPFEILRSRFRHFALNYCSAECYQLHRSSMSGYNPDRQGQRIARAVMESHLGYPLTHGEVVHHMDGNCANNDINNLVCFVSQTEHLRFHHQMRILGFDVLPDLPHAEKVSRRPLKTYPNNIAEHIAESSELTDLIEQPESVF